MNPDDQVPNNLGKCNNRSSIPFVSFSLIDFSEISTGSVPMMKQVYPSAED